MRIVITTAPEAAAEEIGARLVEEGLAACATVFAGARSIYRWKGAVERATESLIVLKTSESKASELMDRIRKIHPYELPEIVSIAPDAVLAEYDAWVAEAVSMPSRG